MEAGNDAASILGSGEIVEEEQPTTLNELKNAAILKTGTDYIEEEKSEKCTLAFKIVERIKELSRDELREEAAIAEVEEWPLLRYAVEMIYPRDAIALLCDALGIDTQDSDGKTILFHASFHASENWNVDLFEELLDMKIDLSVRDNNNRNIFDHVTHKVDEDDKKQLLNILAKHGVMSADIPDGFRSTLHDSTFISQPNSLAAEIEEVRFYIRAMTLSLEELEKEAKGRDEDNFIPLMFAAGYVGMGAALERLQGVYCSSVNATDDSGANAIIQAAVADQPDNVRLLATMGTDLSLRNRHGENVFDYVKSSRLRGEETTGLFEALAEHGITSSDIPANFQSPLYFESKYYDANLREQRWIARRALMMCLDRVFNWSLANQIVSEFYMTLPPGLSSAGMLVARCCMHVDASSVSNGIARLIMEFAFGFNKQRDRLVGMPREEIDLLDDEERAALRRVAEAAAEEARIAAESARIAAIKKATNDAAAAAASLLAELDLEEEIELKKSARKGQDSKKKKSKKQSGKKNKK
jgi:ankyrin repeat protein